MPSYQATIDYLYQRLPVFQRVGAAALKPDLKNTLALCKVLGNPQHRFPSVHIAGTNGKGSSSHMLAAILQAQGYRTGLYTSPHLKAFTERIKIDGQEIPEQRVIEFTQRIKPTIERVNPSFFEVTVAMAFDYFAREQVDIAVIETGMGGRLDSTNILQPLLSLITNIGWDHMDLLGDTLPKIAAEKAGIIKPKTPVVVSEYQPEVAEVFKNTAQKHEAALYFAADHIAIIPAEEASQCIHVLKDEQLWFRYLCPALKGAHQVRNLVGVLAAIDHLPISLEKEAIRKGIEQTNPITGFKGRYQQLSDQPKVIADIAHNADGVEILLETIQQERYQKLHLIMGTVKDKDHNKILTLLPKNAHYYFTQAQLPRSLKAEALAQKAAAFQLKGDAFSHVEAALARARAQASPQDLILIFGSNFVVAELEGL